ncbi:MAG: hypothetical protein ACRCT1_15495 [Microcoleaceae cyanobacterium]
MYITQDTKILFCGIANSTGNGYVTAGYSQVWDTKGRYILARGKADGAAIAFWDFPNKEWVLMQ